MKRILPALLLLLPTLAHAQETFPYLVTNAPPLSLPYVTGDVLPVVRGGITYNVPAITNLGGNVQSAGLSTNHEFVIWSGTTGKIIQDSTGLNITHNGAIQINSSFPTGDGLQVLGTYTGSGTHQTEQLANISLVDTGSNVTGFAKLSALTTKSEFGGPTSGEANRNSIFAWLLQTGITPYTSGNYHFHTAVFGYTDIEASDGLGLGQYYSFGGLTELTNSVTAKGVKGAEFDTSITAGSSSPYHATLTVDLVNSHAVRGSSFDAAISIGADGSVTATYANGLVFGDPNGIWPFANDSTLVNTSGGTGTADVEDGINLSGIGAVDCIFKSASFCDTGRGSVNINYAFPKLAMLDTGVAAPVSTNGALIRIVSLGSATDSYEWQINTAVAGDFSTVNHATRWGQDGSFTALHALVATTTFGMPAIATDATHTDATVCVDTTSKLFFFGSGAAGICLGTSSLRFKTDVHPLAAGLPEVLALRAIDYRYKPGYGGEGVKYGFAAEQVAEVLPQLVGHDSEGQVNTVDWAGVVPVLVKAIQDLNRKVEARR